MNKNIIIMICFLTFGCSNSYNLKELNIMTDWNKSEISNKTANKIGLLVENFIEQRNKDIEILKLYNIENEKNSLMLINNWNELINITSTMEKTKLIGKLQVIKRKILIEEINNLKLDINKRIEVIENGKKDSL
ncbi:MAG: hypothetical protein ACRC1T_09230 [Clostridium chrysemydis]|uniref:hypothetical protein n=1 Tax=Clostridium chrysemydis TaxID=2665504 RepID=UPI003F2A13D9